MEEKTKIKNTCIGHAFPDNKIGYIEQQVAFGELNSYILIYYIINSYNVYKDMVFKINPWKCQYCLNIIKELLENNSQRYSNDFWNRLTRNSAPEAFNILLNY